MPRLLYQIVGDLDYENILEKNLEQVRNDFCFDEIISSENKEVGKDLNYYYNQLASWFAYGRCEKYDRRIVKSVEGEVKKIGDRKVIFYSVPNERFLILNELEQKYVEDYFFLKIVPKPLAKDEELEPEVDEFIDKLFQSHEKAKQKYAKEFARYKEYTREKIYEKIKNNTVFLNMQMKELPFISVNNEINKYYDWSYIPCTTYFIPESSNYLSIQTLLPMMRHELNHTFNILTGRTKEGMELYSLLLFKQAGLYSCADIIDCVGIDLACFMEDWHEFGRRCKSSIEAYQSEIGDSPVRKIKEILRSF